MSIILGLLIAIFSLFTIAIFAIKVFYHSFLFKKREYYDKLLGIMKNDFVNKYNKFVDDNNHIITFNKLIGKDISFHYEFDKNIIPKKYYDGANILWEFHSFLGEINEHFFITHIDYEKYILEVLVK